MEHRPRMLAAFVQGTLESVDRVDPELGRAVRRHMQPEKLRALESASRIAFVPLELDVEVTRCLFEVSGPARAREIFRSNMAATFESPILSSFMAMALRLRGRDPARLLGWCSKVWGQLYRDAGGIEFESLGDDAGRFQLHDLPPLLTAHPEYLDGIAAAISAVFDVLDVPGAAELGAVDADAGRAIIHAAWEPDAAEA